MSKTWPEREMRALPSRGGSKIAETVSKPASDASCACCYDACSWQRRQWLPLRFSDSTGDLRARSARTHMACERHVSVGDGLYQCCCMMYRGDGRKYRCGRMPAACSRLLLDGLVDWPLWTGARVSLVRTSRQSDEHRRFPPSSRVSGPVLRECLESPF